MDKVNEMILKKFHKKYPTTFPILTALLEGEPVENIAIRFDCKESSVRNLKSRYRELFHE